jgi:ABC-type branched-subunit amino acid transport system substrate-binding protein
VSGADTIYWIAAYTDAVSLVKQWAQSPARNMDLFLQSSAGSYVSFWKMTGGRALGVSEAAPEIGIPYTKLSKPFLEKLKAKGAGYCGAVPTAYDGPWILKEAIEKAGSADNVEKLIKIVEDNQFQHGFFVWAFDKRHDPKLGYPYVSLTIGQFQEDGRYVLVHPKELVEITNPKDKYVRVKDLRKRAGLE